MISVARNDVEVGTLSFKSSALMGIETTAQYLEKTRVIGKQRKSISFMRYLYRSKKLQMKNVH